MRCGDIVLLILGGVAASKADLSNAKAVVESLGAPRSR
jgi:hypothetical protein